MNGRVVTAGVAIGSLTALLALTLVGAAPLTGDKTADQEGRNSQSKGVKSAKDLPIFTPAREAAALAFVAQHHPELRKLLKTLSGTDKEAYELAICEIFADTESLADVLAKDADLYAIALEQWKVRSRIELLAARMRDGTPTSEQEKKIKALLHKQVELELEQRKKEIGRFEQMLERRRSDLAQRSASIDKTVQNRLNRLLKTGN